ncbi:MAG: tRNA (N(6)-L-threonylcarbamoyladenosine(37)-C(2))-methylthiotransferase MtaB [Pseudomonadota bacterium]
MRIHIKSMGCRLNEAEAEGWADKFSAVNHQITRMSGDAQVIVFNSCAVTQQAVRSSRQAIRRLQRETPTAKIVATGCYASLHPEEAAELGVDLVVNNKDKDQLAEIVSRELALTSMPEAATLPSETSLFARGRQRAFIKVQDGCRYRCTYCIVTLARGDERSRPIAEIVAQVQALADSGVQEVVLTGVHLGGYGSDLDCHLYDLIRAVLDDTDIPRIRFGSLEPWDLPKNFFALFADQRLMPHLHLPLQSGCDSVLRRMSRRCKTDDFRGLVESVRAEVPNINITTDIIVGFPGETDEEWAQSLDYVRSVGFGHCHIFSYSPRAGTKAARLPNTVHKEIKKQRSQQLHALAEQMKLDTFKRHLGQDMDILLEGDGEHAVDGTTRYSGYTPNYLRVSVEVDDKSKPSNQIVRASLESINPDGTNVVAKALGDVALV